MSRWKARYQAGSVAAPKPWNMLILAPRLHGISLVEEPHLSKGKRVTAPTDPNVNETDVFNKNVRLQQKEI